MKKKRFDKRLVLNKTTVTDLNTRAMGAAYGGAVTGITCAPRTLCNTDYITCAETQCGTCVNTCPPTWCDTECGC